MDPLAIIKEIGLPAAFCLALGWFIYRQNNYIQNDLAKDLHKKFSQLEHIINDDLRLIIIALINQQKKMQIELRGIKSKYEALVDIIMKLMEVKDKNKRE